jgi:hypothetical protein
MPPGWVAWARRAIRQERLPPVYRGRSAFGREGHECDVTGALDRGAKLALVSSAIAGDAARNDFPALGDQVPQPLNIFIVDVGDLIRTEAADLLAWETPFRGHSLVASCSMLARAALWVTPTARRA